MTEGTPGPVPPELESLFEAERSRPDAPAPARDRVLARVSATLAGAPPTATATATTLAAKPLLLALATFGAGLLTGFGVESWMDRAPEPLPRRTPATAQRTAPSPPAPAAHAPATQPGPELSVQVIPPQPAPPIARPRSGRASPLDDALEAERVILQRARAHVRAGDGAAALREIAAHARAFPAGALAEEREALAVRALLLNGDDEAARARAAEFRRRFARSIYLPAVEQALESTP